jgi:hypothetical protein
MRQFGYQAAPSTLDLLSLCNRPEAIFISSVIVAMGMWWA